MTDTEMIMQAINGIREDMKKGFEDVNAELNQVHEELGEMHTELDEIQSSMNIVIEWIDEAAQDRKLPPFATAK